MKTFVVLCTLTGAASAACFAPDHAEKPGTNSTAAISYWTPKLAVVGAMLKKNAALLTIQDTRLRLNTFVGYQPPNAGGLATIRATLYPKNTWVGTCELIAGPEFFNSGSVAVTFNQVQDVFQGSAISVRGDGFNGYMEPKVKERIGDVALYDNNTVVLTSGGIAPWVYVSTEEYLGVERKEREERLEQTTEMLKNVQQYAKNAIPEAQRELNTARKELADFEARLRALSPQARQAPAELPGKSKIVKLNPVLTDAAFTKKRAYLVSIFPIANDRKYLPALLDAMRQLDYAALRRMLE